MTISLLLLAACKDDPPGKGGGPDGGPDDSGTAPAGLCEAGTVCTIAGAGMQGFNLLEGQPLDVWLAIPSAALLDPEGRLVVVDYNNNVLRRFDEDGVLRCILGNGVHGYAIDGVDADQTPLENPSDAAYGPDGALYVYEQHGARILRVDPDTNVETVYAGDPLYPGYDLCKEEGEEARFGGMTQGWGLDVAEDGTVYYAEPMVDVISEVTPDQDLFTVAGACDSMLENGTAGFVDGPGDEARFRDPFGVEHHDGALYVSDTYDHAIRRIDVETREVTTIAGTGTAGFSGDGGPAVDAQLNQPWAVTVDPSGALFVADSGNHVIRRIDPDGTISTVAGVATVGGYSGDGDDPLAATFLGLQDVLVLPSGDLVVVDTFNNRIRVVGGVAAAAE